MGTHWDIQMPLHTWMEEAQAIITSGKLTTGGLRCGLERGLVLNSRPPNSDKICALGRHRTTPAGYCGLSLPPRGLRSTFGGPGKDTLIETSRQRGEERRALSVLVSIKS